MRNYDVAVIGAGKTGRGFIGRLLREGRHPFLLIDKDKELVMQLEKIAEYKVSFFGGTREPMQVKDFTAVHIDNPGICELLYNTKLIFVSVGGRNLKDVAQWMAKVFDKRLNESDEECSVILCENANKPADRMKEFFLDILSPELRTKASNLIGFSEGTVFCTTIEDNKVPMGILSEDYPRLQCNALPLKGNLPGISGLQPVDTFENFLVRKLYTYNAASAVIAYVGWWKGYNIYSDAANDREILSLLKKVYEQTGKALCKEYGYNPEEQKEFAALSLRKFRDSTIVDTVKRNAREPYRKLEGNERIIGPARLIEKHGGDSSVLEIAAATAILYEDPSDRKWNNIKKDLGIEGILENICNFDIKSPLAQRILRCCENLRK